jgi:hypothetical protein
MKKEQRVERKKNREWICLYKEAEDEIHALLYYCFCLNVHITNPKFIYAVLERYYTVFALSFCTEIMLTDSLN